MLIPNNNQEHKNNEKKNQVVRDNNEDIANTLNQKNIKYQNGQKVIIPRSDGSTSEAMIIVSNDGGKNYITTWEEDGKVFQKVVSVENLDKFNTKK